MMVLGLVSNHWWVELGTEITGYRAQGLLDLVVAYWFVGLGFNGCLRALRIMELVLAGPDPGPWSS